MEQKLFYLYKITNTVNDKLYIGVTKDFEKRKKQHINGKKDRTSLVTRAIRKYGKDLFTFEILCIGDEEYIYDLEPKAIKSYNSSARGGHGYNLSAGGKGGEGGKILKRIDDKAIYVKGFWFPNKRTCLEKMKLSSSSLYERMLNGTAGDLQWLRPSSCVNIPVYVGGFWFPDIFLASHMLGTHYATLQSRIRVGKLDQFIGLAGRARQKLYIEGTVYDSYATAVANSRYTRKMIYRRLNNDPLNFYLI